jgi:hypothetical protein
MDEIRDKVFATVHKYKNEYDEGIKDSNSGDEHCDFVERFAYELIDIVKNHGELELIRGYNKAGK